MTTFRPDGLIERNPSNLATVAAEIMAVRVMAAPRGATGNAPPPLTDPTTEELPAGKGRAIRAA